MGICWAPLQANGGNVTRHIFSSLLKLGFCHAEMGSACRKTSNLFILKHYCSILILTIFCVYIFIVYIIYSTCILYVLYANWCNCADECRALAWLTSPLRSMSLYPDGCLKLYPLSVETWCRVYPYPHILYWQNHLWIFGRMQYIVWFSNVYRHYIDLFHYMYESTYFSKNIWIYIYIYSIYTHFFIYIYI